MNGTEHAETQAVKILVDKGYDSRTRGKRDSLLHMAKRPYREAVDPGSNSYVPTLETVTASATTATVSVALNGRRRGGRETVGDSHPLTFDKEVS